jgi:hypothetical protein
VRHIHGIPWLLVAACARGPAPVPQIDKLPPSVIPASATLYGELDLAAIAQSGLLQEELVVRYRDKALSRFGLRADDALAGTGRVMVFALPNGSAGAYIPGVALDGPRARTYLGVQLAARGEYVSAVVPGGSVTGDPSAVAAALDVVKRNARGLTGTNIEALASQGTAFKTIRLATLEPGQLLSSLPIRPPASLIARLSSAAFFATIEGTNVYASLTVVGRDTTAGRDLAAWVERERQGLRNQLSSWRSSAGIFGGALDPAIRALDAVSVEGQGRQMKVVAQLDLGPIFSSGLFTVLKTLQVLNP